MVCFLPLTHSHNSHTHTHTPLRHRLACFRDDIIFFIYLYQRWVYRVDLTRRNEFGQLLEDEEDKKRREKGEVRKIRRAKLDWRAP